MFVCFSGEEAGQSGQKSMPEPMISHLWSHILETLILRRLCLALAPRSKQCLQGHLTADLAFVYKL